jgi:CrcB protein
MAATPPTPSLLRELALVFLAGGTGASLRVFLVGVLDRRLHETFPFVGTLVVNLVGCFAIGVGTAILGNHWRPVVLGGLLGGFTTYSAFGLLSWELLRQGKTAAFTGQILLHVVGGIVCVVLGLALGRAILGPDRVS